jgi:DNA repair exonuclease SbcCD ATPase subunit
VKYLGLLLVGCALIPLIYLVSFLIAGPDEGPDGRPVVIAVEQDLASFKARLATEETHAQSRLDRLNEAIQAKQSEYRQKTESLNAQILAAQQELAQLQTEYQNLQSEIDQLDPSQTEILSTIHDQLRKPGGRTDPDPILMSLQPQQTADDFTQGNVQRPNR